MNQILAFINGKKTYIAGAGLVGYGLYQIYSGHSPEGVNSILQGFAALGLRHAISKGK